MRNQSEQRRIHMHVNGYPRSPASLQMYCAIINKKRHIYMNHIRLHSVYSNIQYTRRIIYGRSVDVATHGPQINSQIINASGWALLFSILTSNNRRSRRPCVQLLSHTCSSSALLTAALRRSFAGSGLKQRYRKPAEKSSVRPCRDRINDDLSYF